MNSTYQLLEEPWKAPEGFERAWELPGWVEPITVVVILFLACFWTRRPHVRLFGRQNTLQRPLSPDYDVLQRSSSESDSDSRISSIYAETDTDGEDDSAEDFISTNHERKQRRCCGITNITTPNTTQFRHHWHSKVLYKFPFLIEMFYWVLTYGFYQISRKTAQAVFGSTSIWDVAEAHAISILEYEQLSWMSFLFPWRELDVQRWFLANHSTFLTQMNRAYALIHIPGTVFFLAWYYYSAPSREHFATFRRWITLTNLYAFVMFIFYPTMPPRLLPKEYGFIDTVRAGNAQSVWMSGKYVNALAAMPSMHFGYSFIVGCVLIHHSGLFSFSREKLLNFNLFWRSWYAVIGVTYPLFILTTIVATANHYWLDALVAFFVAIFAFFTNNIFQVLLPAEDVFLWCLRVDKPHPTSGQRNNRRH